MLCVEVTNLSFEGGKGRSPSLALHIEVNTKLVSVADNRVIFQKNYEYTSLEYPWRSWKKEKGSLLEMELDVACRELGKQICNEQLKMPAEITDE